MVCGPLVFVKTFLYLLPCVNLWSHFAFLIGNIFNVQLLKFNSYEDVLQADLIKSVIVEASCLWFYSMYRDYHTCKQSYLHCWYYSLSLVMSSSIGTSALHASSVAQCHLAWRALLGSDLFAYFDLIKSVICWSWYLVFSSCLGCSCRVLFLFLLLICWSTSSGILIDSPFVKSWSLYKFCHLMDYCYPLKCIVELILDPDWPISVFILFDSISCAGTRSCCDFLCQMCLR